MCDKKIIHTPEKSIFYLDIEGCTAYVEYTICNGELDILHTVVPEALSGRGFAAMLVKHTYDYAREQGLVPTATCTYAKAWLQKHCVG